MEFQNGNMAFGHSLKALGNLRLVEYSGFKILFNIVKQLRMQGAISIVRIILIDIFFHGIRTVSLNV